MQTQKPQDERAAERRELLKELVKFVCGKTIAAMRFDDMRYSDREHTDIDIIFTDGSELELYSFDDGFAWAEITAEEAAELARQNEREQANE